MMGFERSEAGIYIPKRRSVLHAAPMFAGQPGGPSSMFVNAPPAPAYPTFTDLGVTVHYTADSEVDPGYAWDRSGNGFDAVSAGGSGFSLSTTYGPNNRKAFGFDPTSYFFIPDATWAGITNANTGATIVTVVTPNAPGTDSSGAFQVSTSGSFNHLPFADEWTYTWTPGAPMRMDADLGYMRGAVNIVIFCIANGDQRIYRNGTLYYTNFQGIGATMTWRTVASVGGRSMFGAGGTSSGQQYKGSINMFAVFPRLLDATDRAEVFSRLNTWLSAY